MGVIVVLLGRIELPTSALPRMRSTTELQQHTTIAPKAAAKDGLDRGGLMSAPGGIVKRWFRRVWKGRA